MKNQSALRGQDQEMARPSDRPYQDESLSDNPFDNPDKSSACGIAAMASLRGEFSHRIIGEVLQAGINMEHRGGHIGDRHDGSGILLTHGRELFEPHITPGMHLPDSEHLMVGGVWFMPNTGGDTLQIQHEVDGMVTRHGIQPLGWRKVPVEPSILPASIRNVAPEFWQILMGRGMMTSEKELRKAMYMTHNDLGGAIHGLYFPDFTPDTVVYKTLCAFPDLAKFFPDLKDPRLKALAAVIHRRFSTNTVPRFRLAQPFGNIGHNGEINTNKANMNAVADFEKAMRIYFKVLMRQGSDSANIDRLVELFLAHDISLPETLRRFMTPPFRDNKNLSKELMQFYEGNRRALGNLAVIEGPAAISALDGKSLVGVLDKMGLRPLRYGKTKDGFFWMASEADAIKTDPENTEYVRQIGPGEMVIVDLKAGEVIHPQEAEEAIRKESHLNYEELAERYVLVPKSSAGHYEFQGELGKRLSYFGWDRDRKKAIEDIIENGKESVTSMGYSYPLAIFSNKHPTLFKYMKEITAVVTNPPIDPIREGGAFDLTTYAGTRPKISLDHPDYTIKPQYKLDTPFITDSELAAITSDESALDPQKPNVITIDTTFLRGGVEAMKSRLAQIQEEVLKFTHSKKGIIVLSDRKANKDNLPLPSILLAGLINKTLIDKGLRRSVSIVMDTGEVQEAHDAAALFAHGADAVNPYMMWHIAYAGETEKNGQSERVKKLRKAMDDGLKRIMSKMGITTLEGYRDSQLFEVVGIASEVTGYYLPGTSSYLGGIGMKEIYEDIARRTEGENGLSGNLDESAYKKDIWKALQAVGQGEDPSAYETFLEEISKSGPTYLRDLLAFKETDGGIEKSEVAPEEDIIREIFRGAAMSHGALNRHAHMAIARAFNSFGSMSNGGEGGELTSRNKDGEDAEARSKIRQVASGRFGVDAPYLVSADEIQIKIGQGAKPGEGGHLPAGKVTVEIAKMRRTKPGTILISPPPHHSIYSIEDLAQLVFNLKEVNPSAKISIKVPAMTGLGVIAVGIAKAGVDSIEISGFDGGTGAAMKSSLEHAGLPLERSLAEVHQTLTENGIRQWVKLRADAGIKTGSDVAKLLAMGANEVSFGSTLTIAEMCVMCRSCFKGNCPSGITSFEADKLMKKALPQGEMEERYDEATRSIRNYLLAVAEDLRGILAKLGIKNPEDLTGKVDLLEQIVSGNPRHDLIKLGPLIKDLSGFSKIKYERTDRQTEGIPHKNNILNYQLAEMARTGIVLPEIEINNTDLAVGARLAGMITSKEIKLPEGGFTAKFKGCAGQGFGFAATDGMNLYLHGLANDGVCEAMSGNAKVVITNPIISDDESGQNGQSVVGNAAAYGATGGKLYIDGTAGNRLGVRNSGATIITKGALKYAFEYMTGGVGIVLGKTSEVVGAGMTGGEIYCHDPEIGEKIDKVSVKIESLSEVDMIKLRNLLADYQKETGDKEVLKYIENPELLREFSKIVPVS